MQGLKWKIWIDEPTEHLSGRIYLFETRMPTERPARDSHEG
jgi:hypothetical protein